MEGEAEKEQSKLGISTVFSNELIWKTLGRCLNTSDLKCCRLVSQYFNRMVVDGTDFRNRVVLKVKKGKLKRCEFGKTQENWKKISLEFPATKVSDPSNYTWLFPLLKEVNFLSLSLHKQKSAYEINFHPLLGQLLSTCTKLKGLAMEPNFIRFGSGGIFHGNETLKYLEELELLQPNYRWTDFCGPFPDTENYRDKEFQLKKEFCDALKNLKVYNSYFLPVETSLNVGVGQDGPFLQAELASRFLCYVCNLVVKSNREHIESHPFYDVYQSEPEALFFDALQYEYVQTPALKCLTADVRQLEAKIPDIVNMGWVVLDYLLTRPPLTQIEIYCPLDQPLNITVWLAVADGVFKHAESLKTLKMVSDLLEACDWGPLRQSNLVELRLEDLREDNEHESNDWIREVITSLPGSIRRIYLKGAGGLKAERKLNIQDFSQLNPNIVEELTILNSIGCLTNDVATFICENFRMLRKLHLSDAKTGDQGFLGISQLKGLQFLTLKRCGISNETMGAIAFKELRYLDVSDNRKVTLAGIKVAMTQCPSLETLVMPKPNFKFTSADGRKICPRLKNLLQRDKMGNEKLM